MTQRLRIKICGITTAADAVQAARLGADAIGLNFYPPSPRRVEPAQVPMILRALPPFVEPVGVFVSGDALELFTQADNLGLLRTLQWHGAARVLGHARRYNLIMAYHVSAHSHLEEIMSDLKSFQDLGRLPAAILVDAQVPGQYGGTGQQAPWRLLADFQPGVPLILAGGLTPDNVALAVRTVRPYAVDVASGIESSPGIKDAEKMHRFIENSLEAANK